MIMSATITYALTPTPFIGRSQEIDEIGALLDDPSCRLLTLVGPGGIGKTRLALEAAARAHNGALEQAAELLGLAFHQL
jgi:ATP-dependent Clp protease ATP-binding subunit ClpA